MNTVVEISVIIPVYNGKKHIEKCLTSLKKQTFNKPWEIIIINDCSTDGSVEIIKKYNFKNIKLYSLSRNLGQSAARNLGIKKALGNYIFFQDVDDLISESSLDILYEEAKKTDSDVICSDFKRIENFSNQRENKFNYDSDMRLNYNDITNSMTIELRDPTLGHLGLFGCNGRLIKRSMVISNNIKFEEKLRLIEDKVFGWRLLSFCKKISYIRKQLYSYFVYPTENTAITDSLNYGFDFKHIKLIINNIKECLIRRGMSKEDIEKNYQQGLIFFCIHALITISRPMFLGKINFNKGKQIRRKIIDEILSDIEVSKAIKKYKPVPSESYWIPKAIFIKSRYLVELACNLRAKETIKSRRLGKV